MNWREGLNDAQLEAADNLYGPQLILAGAGSGKTKTMTARICHMIEDGIAPSRILAITFTNKAAKEMRERLGGMLGISPEELQNEGSSPLLCTFHSFGLKLLKKYGGNLGYSGRKITVLDDKESKKVIKSLIEEIFYQKEPEDGKEVPLTKAEKGEISDMADIFETWLALCKDNLISHKDKTKVEKFLLGFSPNHLLITQFVDFYEVYESRMFKNNSVDFADLITKAVYLLEIPNIHLSVTGRYKFVSIDEFQDTSVSQLEMCKLLAGEDKNISVVGDDYQSIYAFRGAIIDNILNFPKIFPGCHTVTLGINYRSTENIVHGAAEVIKNNRHQFEKHLTSFRGSGERIHNKHFDSYRDEASFVASTIEGLLRNGYEYSDIAVLYRKGAHSKFIEDALLRYGIPYTIADNVGFYDRKEVKDIISYLRVLSGYNDEMSLERILNTPRRGIGEKSQKEFMSEVGARSGGLLEVRSSKNAKINEFMESLESESDAISAISPSNAISHLIETFGLREQYENEYKVASRAGNREKMDDALTRVGNIRELIEKAKEYERDNPDGDIEAFLDEISLFTDKEAKTDSVSLMTIHKSKGLEFKAVFVVAQDKELGKVERDYDEEEERRIFYVAMTRAKDNLYITESGTRMLYGQQMLCEPISFIYEIPEEDLEARKPPVPVVSSPFYDDTDHFSFRGFE